MTAAKVGHFLRSVGNGRFRKILPTSFMPVSTGLLVVMCAPSQPTDIYREWWCIRVRL